MRAVSSFRRHLSLLLYKTYADLRAESERTYVGFLWWIVEPIVSMAVYFVVFGMLLDRGTPNYVQFLFVGLVPWRWLQTTISHGANSILAAKSLMRQVYVSKLIFPLVSILTDTFKFLVVFVLVLAFVWISGFPVTSAYLALPLVLLAQLALILSLTLLFAAVTPLLPDIRIALDNLVRLWFFLSGVFYDIGRFSESVQYYLRFNPMTVILESYRGILMRGEWPNVARLLIILAAAAAFSGVGVWIVRRYEYVYPKLRF